MRPYYLTNFEIQKYYQNEPKLNGVYSRNKIKDGAYVINLVEYIASNMNGNNIICFDSLGVEHNPKEIKKFIGNKYIITNICKIQAYDSIMCGYFCIGFIDFMINGKSLLDYTSFLLVIMR